MKTLPTNTLASRAVSTLAAAAIAAAAVLGGATAANAATNRVLDLEGFSTKANCTYAEKTWTAHILRYVGTIHGGEHCAWRGTRDKWGFTILYRS